MQPDKRHVYPIPIASKNPREYNELARIYRSKGYTGKFQLFLAEIEGEAQTLPLFTKWLKLKRTHYAWGAENVRRRMERGNN